MSTSDRTVHGEISINGITIRTSLTAETGEDLLQALNTLLANTIKGRLTAHLQHMIRNPQPEGMGSSAHPISLEKKHTSELGNKLTITVEATPPEPSIGGRLKYALESVFYHTWALTAHLDDPSLLFGTRTPVLDEESLVNDIMHPPVMSGPYIRMFSRPADTARHPNLGRADGPRDFEIVQEFGDVGGTPFIPDGTTDYDNAPTPMGVVLQFPGNPSAHRHDPHSRG